MPLLTFQSISRTATRGASPTFHTTARRGADLSEVLKLEAAIMRLETRLARALAT
jgi:hypothetical protein